MSTDGDTQNIIPANGSPLKGYQTFKTKADFAKCYAQIPDEDKCFKEPIYKSYRMPGFWKNGENNEKIQVWFLGYFVCMFCNHHVGLHDSSVNYLDLRVKAGKNLKFNGEEDKKKFERRKSNNGTMQDHDCRPHPKNAANSSSLNPTLDLTSEINSFTSPQNFSTPNPTIKKRKVSSINSKQIQQKAREALKTLQVLTFATLNIPFVIADKELFYAWLLQLFTIFSTVEGIALQGLILGSTALQENGVLLYEKFKGKIGKLISNQIRGLKAVFSLTTDGWTACDGTSFIDVTMRIMVTTLTGDCTLYSRFYITALRRAKLTKLSAKDVGFLEFLTTF